jgi:hypothetical protein
VLSGNSFAPASASVNSGFGTLRCVVSVIEALP